jgi:GNAT superfamily N-acetyltransferase
MRTLPPLQCREIDASDDMAALTSLIRAAYAPHAEKGLRYWGTHQTVEDTRKRYATGTGLVGSMDGRVVATILLRRPDPAPRVETYRDHATWKFEQFAVLPELRGMGVGKQLHDFALAHAHARGCRRMALDTAAPAEALIALYTAWGYSLVGTCDWRPFTNYPSVVMAKELATIGCSCERL